MRDGNLADYVIDSPKSKIFFNGSDEENKKMCAEFGCGKALTLQESLSGNRCVDHKHKKPIDVTKVIKFK